VTNLPSTQPLFHYLGYLSLKAIPDQVQRHAARRL
jgi:hypothetical protein